MRILFTSRTAIKCHIAFHFGVFLMMLRVQGGGHFDGKMCGGWGEFLGMEGLVGGV